MDKIFEPLWLHETGSTNGVGTFAIFKAPNGPESVRLQLVFHEHLRYFWDVHDYHVVAIRLSENVTVYDALAHIFVHDVVALIT